MLLLRPSSWRLGRRCLSGTLDRLASIGLSEDQLQFQELAQDFADRELAPHGQRWDAEGHFPVDTIRAAAALGFGGLFVDPAHGGTGLTRSDGAVIFEALATGDISCTSYLTIHNMCCWLVDTYASQATKDKYLPRLTAMDLFASYCLTEPGAGSDAGSLSTTARRQGDMFILNGSKAFISGAPTSDVYCIMARSLDTPGPAGISCFLVEKSFKGISFGALEHKMGWRAQPTAAVILEDCEVPVENLIGDEGQGFAIAMKALDGGRINIGACSLGGARSCLDKALAYSGEREQFGRALRRFQSVEFKLADMATQVQCARALVRQAAALLDAKDPEATVVAAMAKRTATDLGFRVANEALQIHGGYGYLADYHVERFVRDLRVCQILEGTNEIMSLITARALFKE